MMKVRDCHRCGHQDYNHTPTACSYRWCDQHCSEARAEFGAVREIPTFDKDGNVQPQMIKL